MVTGQPRRNSIIVPERRPKQIKNPKYRFEKEGVLPFIEMEVIPEIDGKGYNPPIQFQDRICRIEDTDLLNRMAGRCRSISET